MDKASEISKLKERIRQLEEENSFLRTQYGLPVKSSVVTVPDAFKAIFKEVEDNVSQYFSELTFSTPTGEIDISGERYLLVRSAALSYEFLDIIIELYSSNGKEEAIRIGNNFLFDIGHVLGKKDARAFHQKMKLTEPIHKLSAGPVHFAYTGWAHVEILPDSNPTPDEQFVLKFIHHNSFEAESWRKAGRVSDRPVCIMNSGYSSGWCEESFGIPLTTVEVTCVAKGDECCSFIMAPPNKIDEYLKIAEEGGKPDDYEVPVFFKRKIVEDQLRQSLHQKETLLKEVHHRVKNNLQIISSLFKLQLNNIENKELREVFLTSLNRVNTMAQVHELIYGDKDVSSIHLEHYFRHLVTSLHHLYLRNDVEINLEFTFNLNESHIDPDKAIPLGLILNEIASNSFKYAFQKGGTLKVALSEDGDRYTLKISDNGPGLPEKLPQNSLGLSLITILCDQIDAELKVNSAPSGLSYTIIFPK